MITNRSMAWMVLLALAIVCLLWPLKTVASRKPKAVDLGQGLKVTDYHVITRGEYLKTTYLIVDVRNDSTKTYGVVEIQVVFKKGGKSVGVGSLLIFGLKPGQTGTDEVEGPRIKFDSVAFRLEKP